MERWRDVIGFEERYQVSDLGRVRSVSRVVPHKQFGTFKQEGRILRLLPNKAGYLSVSLCKGGFQQSMLVSRLVLEAWVGPCPEGQVCFHGPAGVSDNSVSNLRWAQTNSGHR